MLSFVIGGFYTLIIFATGLFLGYRLKHQTLQDAAEEIRETIKKPKLESGPVKQMTTKELIRANDPADKKTEDVIKSLF